MKHAFPIIALILYLASSSEYTRLFWRKEIVYAKRARILLLLGIIFHSLFVALHLFYQIENDPVTRSGQAHPTTLSTVSALIIGAFLLCEKRYKLSMLGVVAVPLACGFLFASAILFHTVRDTAVLSIHGPLVAIHLITSTVSLVMFGFAFVLASGIIFKEWALRHQRVSLFHERLPALELLENYSSLTIKLGFWLMVVGVITGSFVAIDRQMELFFLDPRFVWSFCTLAIYAALIIARNHWGFRGSRAGWMAIAGFATVIMSFLFVNLSGKSFHVY